MAWLLGLAGSGLIAALAYSRRSLSISGAAAAIAVGTLIYALGSAAWFGTLIAFFASSTLLTKWKQRTKKEADSGYEKTGCRDAGQVLANGGIAALLCAAHAAWPYAVWWWAFVGVMATVNADTWATEIGGFSRTPPISVRSGRRVAPGTSGGVTPLGLAAAAGGAAFIGAAAWVLARISGPAAADVSAGSYAGIAIGPVPLAVLAQLVFVACVAGFTGALADSWLGATWQAMRRCTVCGREVERTAHCGRPAVHVRGARWLGNDAVNLLSSVVGGVIAASFSLALAG